MADRFFASYEDEFNARPNSGRGSVLPKAVGSADPQAYGRQNYHHHAHSEQDMPDQHWFDPQMSDGPYDRPGVNADANNSAPQRPIFVPLDRRAQSGQSVQSRHSNSGQSYAGQSSQTRPAYDPPDYISDDAGVYDAPQAGRNFAPNYPAYDQRGLFMPDRLAKLTQWAGTICSVLVVLGAVYWAYELAVRDARGIPVVRAAEGPLRIAPAVPGGEISANQGLAVNAIAAKAGAEALPDVVTLAPAPPQLTQDDVAQTTSAEAPAAVETTAAQPVVAAEIISATPVTAAALTDLAAKTPDVMPISDEAAVEAALAMALSDGSEPVTKSKTDAAQPAEVASLGLAPDANSDPAVTGVTAPPTSEVDPATIPAGTKLVQLGAFDDDPSARAAWAVLQTQFTDLMGTKALVVQQATSGGRVFYRLRAHGFADEDETRRFCAALLAENASCIPVSQR